MVSGSSTIDEGKSLLRLFARKLPIRLAVSGTDVNSAATVTVTEIEGSSLG